MILILLSSFTLDFIELHCIVTHASIVIEYLNNHFQIDFRIQLEHTENPTVRRNSFVGFTVHGHGHERVFVHEMSNGGQRAVVLVLSAVHIGFVSQKSVHRQV